MGLSTPPQQPADNAAATSRLRSQDIAIDIERTSERDLSSMLRRQTFEQQRRPTTRSRVVGWFLLLLINAAACSLGTNADNFVDGVCAAPEKACDGRCVSNSDPNFGCSRPGCTACGLPNATSSCSGTDTCQIDACAAGFADCDSSPGDGCEVDTSNELMNCGSCGCRCGTGDATGCPAGQMVGPVANGTPACVAGQCTTGLCNPGWGDCNDDPTDGCETAINSDENCGLCGVPCPSRQTCQCSLLGGRTDCSCAAASATSEPAGSAGANF